MAAAPAAQAVLAGRQGAPAAMGSDALSSCGRWRRAVARAAAGADAQAGGGADCDDAVAAAWWRRRWRCCRPAAGMAVLPRAAAAAGVDATAGGGNAAAVCAGGGGVGGSPRCGPRSSYGPRWSSACPHLAHQLVWRRCRIHVGGSWRRQLMVCSPSLLRVHVCTWRGRGEASSAVVPVAARCCAACVSCRVHPTAFAGTVCNGMLLHHGTGVAAYR